MWRGKGPARAEATKTKAYRCSRLTARFCSEKNISEIVCSFLGKSISERLSKYSFHDNRASPGQRPCAGYLSWPCECCFSRFGAGVTLPQPAW